jgi:quercetin dioxygenase-like cupin family protein
MKAKFLRHKLALVVGLSAIVLLGVVAYAATSIILAVGTIPHSELIDGPATVTARQLLIPPGEVGAWHYHPGLLISVVKRGTVTIEDGCGGEETFTAGQAFEQIGGRVHRAKNLGTEEVEEYNMFVAPEGSPFTVNIPNNERRCGPPRSVNECKDGGWMNFTHPRSFKKQRDCIRFVKRGGDCDSDDDSHDQ